MCFSTDKEVIRLNGKLTPANVISVRKQGEAFIAALAKKKARHVRLDIDRLKTTSTLSLSLLLCWLRCAQTNNIDLKLSSIPVWLKNLSDMHNMSSFFVSPKRNTRAKK